MLIFCLIGPPIALNVSSWLLFEPWSADLLVDANANLFFLVNWVVLTILVTIWPTTFPSVVLAVFGIILFCVFAPLAAANDHIAALIDVRSGLVNIVGVVAAIVAAYVIFLIFERVRTPGGVLFGAEVDIAAAPEAAAARMTTAEVFDNATVASIEREGDIYTIRLKSGSEIQVEETIDQGGLRISTISGYPQRPGAVSYAVTTFAPSARGVSMRMDDEVSNECVSRIVMYWFGDIVADAASSHRDRIEGRRPVSVRDARIAEHQKLK